MPRISGTRFRGHTQRDVRRHNIIAILELARDHGPLSRTDMARRTGLTKATISALVSHFESIGILKSAGIGESWNGPKPRLLELNNDYRHIIGVDLSDTHFEVGVVNLAGELCFTPLQGNCLPEHDLIEQVAPLVDKAMSDAAAAGLHVAGIGVAISGLVDHVNGTVIDSTVFGVENLQLQAELERRYELPVRIDGDVHARLLAESRKAGPDFKDSNVIYVYVGTGIGASLYMDGHIYRGSGGFAGEIGHIPVANDVVCACGHRGCLEAVAAWPALTHHMPGRNQVRLTPEQVAEWAQAGNADALQACADLGLYLGKGLAALITVLNPDMVILGGDIARYPSLFQAPLLESIKRFSRVH